jgi:hypothetical protein
VMALAERAGLSDCSPSGSRSALRRSRRRGEPAGKITSIVARMAAGADSIDDERDPLGWNAADVSAGVRAGDVGPVPASSPAATPQLASVARALSGWSRYDLLPGIESRAYWTSTGLRAVYGHAKQASYGHASCRPAGCVAVACTHDQHCTGAPVIAASGCAGKAGSGKVRRRWCEAIGCRAAVLSARSWSAAIACGSHQTVAACEPGPGSPWC